MGFLIQARRVGGDQEPIGEFYTREASRINCGGGEQNTITHRNNREKSSVSAQWIAPKEYEGEIYFKYTVALDYYTYWVGVETATLRVTRESSVSDVPKHRYRRDERSK